jgi:hypothetical protein
VRGFGGGNPDRVRGLGVGDPVPAIPVGLADQLDKRAVGPDRIPDDEEPLIAQRVGGIPDLILHAAGLLDDHEEVGRVPAAGALDGSRREPQRVPARGELEHLRRCLHAVGEPAAEGDDAILDGAAETGET